MDDKTGPDIPGVTDENLLFHYRLGVFHGAWSTVDLMTDMAIAQFLGLDAAGALMVTWGQMFGAKAKLLVKLVRESDHPRKQEIMTALNAIRGQAKRDVLAHGYQFIGPRSVGFLEKSRSTDFKTRMHEFTHDEFRAHLVALIESANALQAALAFTTEQGAAFAEVAISLSSKD